MSIAAYCRSLFSLRFLNPLFIKLRGLILSEQSQALDPDLEQPVQGVSPGAHKGIIICKMCDFGRGFLLVQGSRHLVTQFQTHYCRYERYRHSFNEKRFREIVFLVPVFICIVIFSTRLIVLVFASEPIQWTWPGYQLYTIMQCILFASPTEEHGI